MKWNRGKIKAFRYGSGTSAPECCAPRRRPDLHELHLQTELVPGARCPKFTGLCLSMSRHSLIWLVAAGLAIAGIAAARAWLNRESTLASAARSVVERSQASRPTPILQTEV